jgi:hypothetical protein
MHDTYANYFLAHQARRTQYKKTKNKKQKTKNKKQHKA